MTAHKSHPPPSGGQQRKTPHRALFLDIDLYQHQLESDDYTDAQKREFVEALWSIMTAFVDLGFGIHPLQQIDCESCGQLAAAFDEPSRAQDDALDSEDTEQTGGAR